MNVLSKIFDVFLSIATIGVGVIGLFFTDWYTAYTIRWDEKLYEKTKLSFYKLQAKEMGRPYMKILIKLISLSFIILGILALLGKIPNNSWLGHSRVRKPSGNQRTRLHGLESRS